LDVMGIQLRAASSPVFIKDHVPAILAALRISEADLAALRIATGLEDRPSETPQFFAPLQLENLSALYRRVVLAKALRLTIKDLVDIGVLTGIDPFAAGAIGPQQTSQFVAVARKIEKSGF